MWQQYISYTRQRPLTYYQTENTRHYLIELLWYVFISFRKRSLCSMIPDTRHQTTESQATCKGLDTKQKGYQATCTGPDTKQKGYQATCTGPDTKQKG